MALVDPLNQLKIDERAEQLNGAAKRESLGLSIKHETVASIRKVGEDLVFTPDQLTMVVYEIKKCRKDIIYFAEKYFRIIGDGGLQLIKLYPKQKELLLAMQRERRLICLAPRQCGKSTTYTIFCLWFTMFFPEKRIAITAQQFGTAAEILGRIKLAYEYLPKEIKPAVVTYNEKCLGFDNNSEVRAFATGGNTIRGFSFDVLFLDEFAIVPPNVCQEFFTSMMPVLSSRTQSKAVIMSTPKGSVNNMFYDIWSAANGVDASLNKEGWVPFRIHYWDVPGRTEEWKTEQIATMGIDKWRQEFECEFTSSGEALLLPDEVIHKFRKGLTTASESIMVNLSQDEDKQITAEVWKEYIPGRVYLAGCDVCEGTGNDASALYILDATNLREEGISMSARISSSSVSVLEFANACAKLLKQYNWPTIIVENNGVGSGFVEALLYTFNVPAARVFSETKQDGTVRYGIHSSNANKLEAALFARELLTTEEIPFTLPDKHLVDEMATFVRRVNQTTITYRASGKAHDDHIMAFIWGLYLLYYRNIEKYYVVKEAFKAKKGQVLPSKLENTHDIENPQDILKSAFHRMVLAALNDDPTALDVNLQDDEMKQKGNEQEGELYYGASGRGYSFGKKDFVTINQGYSQFDYKKQNRPGREEDDEDFEEPSDGQVVFLGI